MNVCVVCMVGMYVCSHRATFIITEELMWKKKIFIEYNLFKNCSKNVQWIMKKTLAFEKIGREIQAEPNLIIYVLLFCTEKIKCYQKIIYVPR